MRKGLFPPRAAAALLVLLLGVLPGLLAAGAAEPATSPAARRSARERPLEAVVGEMRSPDPFQRGLAEGELKRRGTEALPAMARALADPDPSLRMRLWPVYRSLAASFLDDLDSDATAHFRDSAELAVLRARREKIPPEIEKLKKEVTEGEAQRPAAADTEEQRRRAADTAEKAQRLRLLDDALADAEARIPDLEGRIPERATRLEEGRRRALALGATLAGLLTARREAVLPELVPHYEGLVQAIREGLTEEDFLPALGPRGGGEGPFDRLRYLLSTLWAREVDRKGPLAARSAELLDRHLQLSLEELRSPDPLRRERAEEDLYALGPRGLKLVTERASALEPGQAERLQSLYDWRTDPRVQAETGMDFRGYSGLPFRARRRLVIRYARVAGRAAVPTLRLIALDAAREPSLRVRLAAAEALAGPNIRDRTAIEKLSRPELLKIPEIARELAIIQGVQLLDEKRYAEAVAEFRKILDEYPYDFQANYRIAFAYLLLKNYPKAILHFEIARRVQPGDDLTLYNLACAYSLHKDIAKALEALQAAVEAGFTDYQHMEKDPDLDNLRSEPDYHALVERLRQEKPPESRRGKSGNPPPR